MHTEVGKAVVAPRGLFVGEIARSIEVTRHLVKGTNITFESSKNDVKQLTVSVSRRLSPRLREFMDVTNRTS
jgi:hypothetical protein